VSINQLADMAMSIAGKTLRKHHIPGPIGVRGRNSDNHLIRKVLAWEPSQPLRAGLEQSYRWIENQVHQTDDVSSIAA
jgi:GDP-D-mannose 3',5'-epimerase